MFEPLFVLLRTGVRLLLASLGSGLGDLSVLVLLGDVLDDTDGNGLTHVSDSEPSERRIFGEGLDAQGLGRNEENHSSVTRFDALGGTLNFLTVTSVDLAQKFLELAGNVSSVAIQHGGITSMDLTRVVQNDDLSGEVIRLSGGIVLGVTSHVTTADILDRHVLHVEADVVTRGSLRESLVVHFNRLDFSGDTSGSEGDNHARLQDTSLNTTDGYCTNTANLVDVLQGDTERLVDGPLGGLDGIQSFEESATLPPGEIGGVLNHVVSMPARDGDERNVLGVVSDLLEVTTDFLLDFFETLLIPVDGRSVHLVDDDDHLLHTESESKESVLTGLAVLGNTSFEFTFTGSDNQNSDISLG